MRQGKTLKGKHRKRCSSCGQVLDLQFFYSLRSCRCKVCERERKRAAYQKKPEGTYFDPKSGRYWTHKGFARCLFWSTDMKDYLRAHYARRKNEELAGELGVSIRSVRRKALELGLEKDRLWLRRVAAENRLLADVERRRLGYPGSIRKGEHRSPATEFKRKSLEL